MNLTTSHPLPTTQRQQTLPMRLRTLYNYRELLYNLVVRELRARYKNSVLGFFWSLLNPLAMMLVFSIVFQFVAPNNSYHNYPIYLLCGILPWNYFSAALMGSTGSIVNGSGLIKKVYFPREVLPIASVLSQLINFLLALVVLFAAIIVFQAPWSAWLWLLPVVIFLQTCFVLGLSFILATVNVFYRDVMIILDVVVLAWFFLTPVFYPLDFVPETVTLFNVALPAQRLMFIFNPMASLVNTYRDILYWGYRTDLDFFLRTAVTSLLMLAIGYWVFNRYSSRFGEEL